MRDIRIILYVCHAADYVNDDDDDDDSNDVVISENQKKTVKIL